MNKKSTYARRIFIGIKFPRRITSRLLEVDKVLFAELGKRRVNSSFTLTLFLPVTLTGKMKTERGFVNVARFNSDSSVAFTKFQTFG